MKESRPWRKMSKTGNKKVSKKEREESNNHFRKGNKISTDRSRASHAWCKNISIGSYNHCVKKTKEFLQSRL